MTMKWCVMEFARISKRYPDFHVVGEASSGEETLGMVSELIPDIVLLDLIMPGMDGIETTRRIRQISPRTQVVVLLPTMKMCISFQH
jgi:DNA-binding NarL/FixJ family response regulator